MPRRRIDEHDAISHDRWMISYADFVTLLFAFFVVMYSISQVNENKYRVLSNTLNEAFNIPELSLDPIQIGEEPVSNPLNLIELEKYSLTQVDTQTHGEDTPPVEDTQPASIPKEPLPEEFEDISGEIEKAFGDLIEKQLLTLRGDEKWLEIELKSSMLFGSGNADLGPEADFLLGEIAAVLAPYDNAIRVEGFTDSVPINTSRFASNWDLSAARASTVVRLLAEEGVQPSRLAAMGYGEHQPIADNTTPQGRAANRRVNILVSRHGEMRPNLDPIDMSDEAQTELLTRADAAPDGATGSGVSADDDQGVSWVDGMLRLLGVDAEGTTEPGTDTNRAPLNPATEAPSAGAAAPDDADSIQGINRIERADGTTVFTNEPPDDGQP